MCITNIKEQKHKARLLSLMDEFNEYYQQRHPTHGFTSINIFKGYEYYVSKFFIKRLDREVLKNKDFMIIHDIKYKHELSVSYTAHNDYDDLIEKLATMIK